MKPWFYFRDTVLLLFVGYSHGVVSAPNLITNQYAAGDDWSYYYGTSGALIIGGSRTLIHNNADEDDRGPMALLTDPCLPRRRTT
jgi:hypothetical protein